MQLVPGALAVALHAPFAQPSVMHSLLLLQVVHCAPAVPHAAVVFPAAHEVPFQQPPQQLPLQQ